MPTLPADPAALHAALQRWFRDHRRDMPWVDAPTPYAIWIAVVMLQQTQLVTVAPYFQRWMQRFPHVEALAEAALDDVLKQWQGLGYYMILYLAGLQTIPIELEEAAVLDGAGSRAARTG